ncbi:MAG: hypothetical protein N2749_01105 [Clostridia bacterium]|nr:hypothetical protein [Clostridia bacterium]
MENQNSQNSEFNVEFNQLKQNSKNSKWEDIKDYVKENPKQIIKGAVVGLLMVISYFTGKRHGEERILKFTNLILVDNKNKEE